MGTGLLYSPAESAQLLPLVSKIHATGLQIVGAVLFLLHSHTESAQLLPLESESCRQPCTAALILEDHLPLGGSCKAVATLEPNYRDFGRHSYMHRCIVCSCTRGGAEWGLTEKSKGTAMYLSVLMPCFSSVGPQPVGRLKSFPVR